MAANTKAKEPDWGKFGLDNEGREVANGGGGDDGQREGLFGGQVQHDNELFADDQARPVANIFSHSGWSLSLGFSRASLVAVALLGQ